MDEREWEQLLHIKTAGRDDSHSDGEHHPYEPTDYGVLERLANSGYIGKKDTLIDYGSAKDGSASSWLIRRAVRPSVWNTTGGYGKKPWPMDRRRRPGGA